MAILLWSIAILAGLYGLHRLALWMEERGWIFYMKKQASPDTLGNAIQELHQFVRPEVKHVLQAKRPRLKQYAQGDSDEPEEPEEAANSTTR